MTKKKKVIIRGCILLLSMLVIAWSLCNVRISRNTERIVTSTYETAFALGGYGYFSLNTGYGSILSEKDYQTIAAGSSGIWDEEHSSANSQLDWDWDIHSIHTIFYGFGASSYVHDSCLITASDGTNYTGYNRHIRLDWKWNPENGHYRIINAYEYITPEFPCNVFEFIDNRF